jgi:NADPH:quinone reductase-like Zn-dependent oxidoreductase
MQVRRQRGVMLDRVAELMQQGLFRQPIAEEVGLADFKQALQRQMEGHLPGKTLFKPE